MIMKRATFFGLCIAVAGLLFVRAGYGDDLFVGGESESNGLSVTVFAPDGFSDRVEVYACSDLTSNNWRVAAQNLRPTGDSPARWYAETTNDTGFFIVGNMDADRDGDGLPDAREKYVHKTNSDMADSDDDGMADGWEVQYAFNPLTNADASGDADSDGFENAEECRAGSNPFSADTDGDGFIDPHDLNVTAFDYPVAGQAVFNMISASRGGSYSWGRGFGTQGAQTLILRWSDGFWYPEAPPGSGSRFQSGMSRLYWSGERLPDDDWYVDRYKDDYWHDLDYRNWDPSLLHPLNGYDLHPSRANPPFRIIANKLSDLLEEGLLQVNAPDDPEKGARFVEVLNEDIYSEYVGEGQIIQHSNYFCAVFSYE